MSRRQKEARYATSLSVEHVEDVFRDFAENTRINSRGGALARLLGGANAQVEISRHDDNIGSGRPDSHLEAWVPKLQRAARSNALRGTTVGLWVWDGGDEREVVVATAEDGLSTGFGGKELLSRFYSALRDADPSARQL